MSKAKQNPADQPFNVGARRNYYKKNAWWQSAPYHNNKMQKNTAPKKS